MAKIYPSALDTQPSFHGSAGEKAVYQALLTLDDRYTIFYSFRWLNEDGQVRSEGEGDFIVLHPEHGILSIEVKDGGIDYDGGCWWQTNRRTGTRKRIDPFNQAAATQYRLQAILKERTPTIFTTVCRADQFVAQMLREGLAPEDIAILTIHSVKHSHLPLDTKLAGHALSLMPEPDKILFTSTRKFKGLEAKAVLLIDAETSRLDDPLIRRLLYVGASRAALCLEVAFYEDNADAKNRATRKADEDALCVRLGLQNH